MLGLGKQVGGDPGGVVLAVGDDQDLRRPGDHVDADGAEDLALGGGHVGVARADDLVHRSDGFGAEGEGGDGLGAADAVDLGDAGQLGGGQHQRIEDAIGRRHRHHQALDAGHLGGQGIHQHGRGIGRRAAGNVKPRRGQGRPAIAQAQPRLVDVIEVLGLLAAVEIGDAAGRQGERLEGVGVARTAGGGQFIGRHAQGLGRQIVAVEALGVGDEGGVAPGPHLGEDGGDRRVDVGVRPALGGEPRREGGLEAGIARIKTRRHGRPP